MILQITRFFLLCSIFILIDLSAFSQSYSSKDNYTGTWVTPASWSPTWTSPQTIVNGHNITINGYITANSSLSFSGSSNLTVKDTLVVKGNLTLNDNNDLKIEDNGILIVWGDLTISYDTHIEANGYLIVTGNIIKVGDVNHGEYKSNDDPVKVFVGGTIPSGLTDHNDKYKALDCTAPNTTPYPNSGCSHGNLTDLANNPIYPFFLSTCSIATPIITAGGPTTFCAGGSVTLTSSTGTTYLWSNGATTQSINVTSSGSYTVRVTNATGCQSPPSVATIVTVNALPATPTITAGGPVVFCEGGSVALSASASNTYLWSTGATTASINVNSSGSYTLRVTNANGCQSPLSVATLVTVNSLPATPSISAGGPTTFCAGGSVTLTSSTGSSFLWSNGATISSINVISSGSYTVRVTNSNGCQSALSAATPVTDNALPATPTITASGPTTFCAGSSVTLTSGAGTNYLWSNSAITPAISITTGGSYSVQITDVNGCQSLPSLPTIVTVNSLPLTPTISAGGPTAFCAGGSVTLTSSAGESYIWSTGSTTPGITTTSSGSHTVRVTNTNGCQSAESVPTVVIVNDLPPAPIITPYGPTTFCAGGSVTLTSSVGASYLWSTGATTPEITITSGGSYTVSIKNGNGCQSSLSAATVVNINQLPSVNAGADLSIPNGTSTPIDATITGDSPFIYNWSPPGLLVNPSLEDPTTVNLTSTTIFTLTATSIAMSCSNVDETTITITGGPLSSSPSATPGTVCAGENIQLHANAGGGSGTYTYTWTSTPVGFNSSVANPVASPVVSTTYNLSVYDGFTTSNSQVAVIVNAVPGTPIISADGPTTLCTGESVNLTSNAASGYLWSNGAITQTINVTESGNFSVNVTNASGCFSASSTAIIVTVNSLPVAPTITPVGPTTFCEGDNVTLTSSAGTSYLWSTGATTSSIIVTTSGSYSVRVTNTNGCQSALSAPTIVTVNTLPVTPVVTAGGLATFCEGGSVTLTSSPGNTYLWSTGAATSSINVTLSGNYSVNVTDANGCQSAPSSVIPVTVNTLPATPSIAPGGPLAFCAGGSVTLTSSAATSYIWSNGAATSVINVSETGSYTVRVTDSNGCQSALSGVTLVTVNPLPVTPTITAGGPTTFCVGGSVTLTSSPESSYLWSNGATTQSINVISSGNYIIIATNAAGCQSAPSVATIVTVNALPATPFIGAGGPTVFCEGGSVSLSASAGNTYLWSTGATTANIDVNTSGNYSASVTDANGCQSAVSAATNVTVNSLPAVPIITAGDPFTFCSGGSVTLTSSPESGYLWSTGAVTQGINISSTGIYTVKVTNSVGCQSLSSAASVITVNSLPVTPVITAVGPTTFCNGGSVTLTSGAGASYLWSTGATTQNINVSLSGSYTLNVTDINGCQSAQSIATIVTVKDLPATPLITPGGPTTFCTGGSVTLTSSNGSGYLWSDGSITQSINSAISGTYTVQTSNASGCISLTSQPIMVTVRAIPQVSITSSDGPLCSDGQRTLTGVPSGGTFVLTKGPGSIIGNILSGTGSGDITIDYIYTDGCSNKASQTITMDEQLVANAGLDQKLLYVFETQMAAEMPKYGQGNWSLVSGTGNISDIQSPTTSVTGLSIGENKFTWKVSNGSCESSDEVIIVVTDIVTPTVITPNEDGLNDELIFPGLEAFPGSSVMIYNRWGSEIYRNPDYKNDWRGKDKNNRDLQPDTYYYVIRISNGRIIKGFIEIRR